ncbi:uncharacterized protein LOC129927807 [Biomphalaria glabrata]|uniref:Uncharacterized protein LOC129927807 n=1 Tax=Biomphalaria glabrata TaxID=6526 RepID=A0A9W3B6Q4_BIOGL|nr:uncharacterized protein LOC129927807 [Biomphalaria glabrata]
MMNSVVYGVLVCALGIVGIYGQDVTPAPNDVTSIYQAIDVTTSKAREGIKASELEAAMDDIRNKADEYLNEKGAKVEKQDIVNLLAEVTSKYNQGIVLSTFLEDPLVQEGRKVSAGLYTLNELSRRLKEADNETLINTLVAAVQYTAGAIKGIVLTAEAIYTYNRDDSNNGNSLNKRWEVTGTDDDDLSRRVLPTRTRFGTKFSRPVVSKRQWRAGVSAGYSSGGGFSAGASLSYTWRG